MDIEENSIKQYCITRRKYTNNSIRILNLLYIPAASGWVTKDYNILVNYYKS